MITKEYIPYIYKLQAKNERQLKIMLDSLEKEITKIKAEKTKLESKLKEKVKRGHFLKNALIERLKTPSIGVLEKSHRENLKKSKKEKNNGKRK